MTATTRIESVNKRIAAGVKVYVADDRLHSGILLSKADIEAIRAEARQPAVAPLDVERLAAALEYTGDGDGVGYDGSNLEQFAANLAAAYAAEEGSK